MNITTPFIFQLGYFIIIGFFIGLCYETFRILRIVFIHNDFIIGIEDTLFLSLCGIMIFGFSMEIGNGQFRIWYIFSAVIGIVIYFFTLGKILKIVFKFIVIKTKSLLKLAFKPLTNVIVFVAHKCKLFFVKMYKKTEIIIKNIRNNLHSDTKMLYNINTGNYTLKNVTKGADKGEEKRRIKAQNKKIQ